MAECGLLNLASCLPEAFFSYISGFLNAPLQPLLDLNRNLLSTQVNIQLFASLWAVIIYVLSMFYAILIIYAGFQFIISGYDVQKRENAKVWLRNIIIMIVLVQASFFIYELAIQISAAMTSATLSLINPSFFLLTIDNITNVALEIIFFLLYILVLLATALLLIIRYAIVSIGVVFCPIAIFCYFIEPLKPYGKLVFNFLGICIFSTFLDAIILIGFAKMVEIPLFANIKILVMISAFIIIGLLMFFLILFSAIKSALKAGEKVSVVVASAAKYFA